MPLAQYDVLKHQDPQDEPYKIALNWIPSEYAAEIGHFLFACASLEGAIITMLRSSTGLPDNIARIIVGSPRISDAITSLCRVAAASGQPEKYLEELSVWRKYVQYVFAVRNVVAHQEPDWRTDWLRYHNYDKAREIDNPTKLLFVCRIAELGHLSAFAQILHKTNSVEIESFIHSHALPPDPRK